MFRVHKIGIAYQKPGNPFLHRQNFNGNEQKIQKHYLKDGLIKNDKVLRKPLLDKEDIHYHPKDVKHFANKKINIK